MTASNSLEPSAPIQPILLTVPEACAQLRISRWMFYRLVQSRALTTVTIGSRRLVRPQDIAEYLERLALQGEGV